MCLHAYQSADGYFSKSISHYTRKINTLLLLDMNSLPEVREVGETFTIAHKSLNESEKKVQRFAKLPK
jgi:hypothetical protein